MKLRTKFTLQSLMGKLFVQHGDFTKTTCLRSKDVASDQILAKNYRYRYLLSKVTYRYHACLVCLLNQDPDPDDSNSQNRIEKCATQIVT
jgi:hypothetical protein